MLTRVRVMGAIGLGGSAAAVSEENVFFLSPSFAFGVVFTDKDGFAIHFAVRVDFDFDSVAVGVDGTLLSCSCCSCCCSCCCTLERFWD